MKEEKRALLIGELEDIRCNNFDADTDEDRALKEAIKVIKALEQEPCDDAISREAVLEILGNYGCTNKEGLLFRDIKELPSVKPQQKIGKWIKGECSQCGEHAPYWSMASCYYKGNYCPNCGSYIHS